MLRQVNNLVFAALVAALAIAFSISTLNIAIADNDSTYRVYGVKENDVLNIRSGPSSKYNIVGMIPPSGSGILLTGNCKGLVQTA